MLNKKFLFSNINTTNTNYLSLINRYNNFLELRFFLNLKIKSGNSKCFKKKYIITYYNILSKLNLYRKSLNLSIGKLNSSVLYRVLFLQRTSITYVNHKRKYVPKLTFSVLSKNKRKFFFIKYLRFFFNNYIYKGALNLIQNNFCVHVNDSPIYNTYKKMHYIFIFKNIKS